MKIFKASALSIILFMFYNLLMNGFGLEYVSANQVSAIIFLFMASSLILFYEN